MEKGIWKAKCASFDSEQNLFFAVGRTLLGLLHKEALSNDRTAQLGVQMMRLSKSDLLKHQNEAWNVQICNWNQFDPHSSDKIFESTKRCIRNRLNTVQIIWSVRDWTAGRLLVIGLKLFGRQSELVSMASIYRWHWLERRSDGRCFC